MTLDEAIEHARDKANEQRYYSQFEKVRNSCIKCAEEHEQLVSWLEELKELREFKEIYQKGMDYSYATFMYNKAIDDFFQELEKYEDKDEWLKLKIISIYQIAEELKECTE